VKSLKGSDEERKDKDEKVVVPKKRARKNLPKDETSKSSLSKAIGVISKLSVQDHLCRNILVHFAVNLIKNKKKSLFIEVLNVLVKSTREVSGNFLFVINLSSSLPSNSELLADEEIFHLIFNKLFGSVKTLNKLHLRLMIRLLTNTSHRVSVDKMKLIAAKFEPKKKPCKVMTELYQCLKEKIASMEAQTLKDPSKNKQSSLAVSIN